MKRTKGKLETVRPPGCSRPAGHFARGMACVRPWLSSNDVGNSVPLIKFATSQTKCQVAEGAAALRVRLTSFDCAREFQTSKLVMDNLHLLRALVLEVPLINYLLTR